MEVGSYNNKKINSGSVTAKNVSFLGTLKNFVGSAANSDGGIDVKEVMMDLTAFIDDGIERVSEDISEGIVKGKEQLSIWQEQFKNTGAKLYDSVESPVGNTLLNGLAWFGEQVVKTYASIANTVVGLVQGLLEFGEALIDTAAIIGTALNTPIYALFDGINWLGSKLFGYEFHSQTMAVWGQTMDFVSTKYVSDAFDDFHQNNAIGKALDEYAYAPFKSTGAAYKVADGVGYVGGIILLSLATAGIGGAATAGTGATAAGTSASASTLATLNLGHVATVEITKQSVMNAGIATFAGFGRNTQNAWADGASLGEGLAYGGAMAAWEGGEMFLGSAINGLKFTGLSGVGGQLLTTGAHVTLDSIDSASSSFINPLMQMIYTPNENNLAQIMYLVNYDENGNQISNKTWDDLTFTEKYDAMFRYNGGWTGVGVNALVGGSISLLTEIPDIYKSVKTAKLDVTQPLPVIDEELIKTQEIPIIKDEDLAITQPLPVVDDTIDQAIKSAPVRQLSQGEILVKNYLDNLQEMQNQGISLQAYLKQNGIDTITLGSKMDAAIYLGDSKLYIIESAKNHRSELFRANALTPEFNDQLEQVLKKYGGSAGNIDIVDMLNDFAPFLTDAQKQTAINLANNGVADSLARAATPEQLNSIFNYTRCGGFEINAWLNDTTFSTSTGLRNARESFSSIDDIQNLISGLHGKNRIFTTADGSILKGLDDFIASASYDDAIVTYRGLKDLYDGHVKIDVDSLKVGSSFSTAGYQSSSIVEAMNYGMKQNDHNIILQIVVPPNSGKAAYIENVTGVGNYGQMEMLIQRNATLTVVGDVEKTVVNGVEKTIIPVVIN